MTEQSKTQTSDRALLLRMWPFARPNKWQLSLALLLTPLTMGTALIQPWLLKVAIDEHIVVQKLDGLQWIAGAFLAVVVVQYLLAATYTMALAWAGQHTILRLREKVYRHLLSLAPSFFDKRPAGALLTRATSDVEALGETLTSGVVTIVLDILMILGILSTMFWLNWKLTLVLLCVSPFLAWILAFFRKRLRMYFSIIRDSLASVNAFLAERLSGVEIVQLFNHQEETHKRFVELNTTYKDASVRSNVFDAAMYAVVDGVGSICIALILWSVTSGWVGAGISIGLLVAFIDYLQRLFRPLQEFSGKIAIIQRATTALEKIFTLLDEKEVIAKGSTQVETLQGKIEFKDVYFAYKDDDILKGVTFTVQPGEVVAIVGPTGCGKTTVTRLINRFYDGYRGSILLDGKELSELEVDFIRSKVAAVRQDVHLFSETVDFNVRLDNPGITDEQLGEAVALVHANEVIEPLPEGMKHVLRERGANLSVGQGQLLTFARTMAYNSPIVILDEATASIDSETEALIQDATIRILDRKTVIVIAHRLSTITAADRILVMEAGKVAESGTHQELLELKGRYASLFESGFSS